MRHLVPVLLLGSCLALAGCDCGGTPNAGDQADVGHAGQPGPDASDFVIPTADTGPATTHQDAGQTCTDLTNLEGCPCEPALSKRPCYTGPASSRGVGVCVDGTQVCNSSGELAYWGPCQGQVLPSSEDCKGKTDNDCNGLAGCNDPSCANDPFCKQVQDCNDPSKGGDLSGCPCDVRGDTRGCYNGPKGTRGVGLCQDGSQTCMQAGEINTWTACSGAVLPTAESCQDSLDNDCNGLTDCQDPTCATAVNCVPECQKGAVAPCYDGPTGTSGVGICKPGTKTCGADNKWGACQGEVTPGKEGYLNFNGSCHDGLDNDCNGLTDCDELMCLIDPGCAPQVCTSGQTRACYTGPAGTQDVGACKSGSQKCADDGKSWGACSGDVLPSPEGGHCDDLVDNDCNGLMDCADPACATAKACCTPVSGTPDMTIWAHSSDTLYQVDPTTFATTQIGTFDNNDEITDIAVTPAGVLYGVSFTSLYRIDKATGKATYVAPLTGTMNNGLTFLTDGTLLASDGSGAVKQIDPSTGAVTAVGSFGNGLSSSGDLVAVQGVMYGISSTGVGGSDASGNNVLLRVDTATGVATAVGPIGYGNVWGLAYVKGRVIAFTNAGQIIEVDPQTGAGSLLATKGIAFWGAGMSPLTPVNPCP